MHWYDRMRPMKSRGQTSAKPTRLGDLAAARISTRAQYFTPDAVVAFMFALAEQAISAAGVQPTRLIRLLDNSIGSGRLIQYASPDRHSIHGIDVDAAVIEPLGDTLRTAGFTYRLAVAGMEQVRFKGFDVCLANPPFSLPLNSPNLVPYPCTSYGQFGPGTAATSHLYAVYQALEAAQIAIILLPRSAVEQVLQDPHASERLRLVVNLPHDTFEDEGASVSTAILAFGRWRSEQAPQVISWQPGDSIPSLPLFACDFSIGAELVFRIADLDDSGPSITTPVTGDNTVRLVRHGNHIVPRYACGLAEAKGQNAILRGLVDRPEYPATHRYPAGVRYKGEGVLNLQYLLCADDPVQAIKDRIITVLEAQGLVVTPDPGLYPYVRKMARRLRRQRTPLKRVAWIQTDSTGQIPETGPFPVTARQRQLVNPLRWGSPAIEKGESLDATIVDTPKGRQYVLNHKGDQVQLSAPDLLRRFTVPATSQTGWKVIEPGRLGMFPDFERALRRRMDRLGITPWLWSFQADDVIEAMLGTTGAILGLEMGLGKSRCGIALGLLSPGRHALITTEAHLVLELAKECRKLGIDERQWQIIEDESCVQNLRKLNFISYARLRMPVRPSIVRTTRPRTYGDALRGRIHTLVADEVHVAAHPESQQARALRAVGARCRFGMTGTPIPNYPRDLLPVTELVAGQNTPIQPYGPGATCLERNLNSMDYVARGIDTFRERFVTTEWVTNEFSDTLQQGAKREIPRIRDVAGYRDWLKCLLKRRVKGEPDVALHVNVPAPVITHHVVPFDSDHLAHYLSVADEFAAFYAKTKKEAADNGKNLNLMLILRRIQEIQFALNQPQVVRSGPSRYTGKLTSKQRWVIERCVERVAAGERFIVFAHSPACLDLLEKALRLKGIHAPALHGRTPPAERFARLDAEFREGSAHGVLLSYQANKTGLNIPQATRVILYDRDWTAKTEDQAIARAVRPEQRATVQVDTLEIEGSLDAYMRQMVTAKRQAAQAGLDWGETQASTFIHMDQIIDQYVVDLAARKGLKPHQLRQELKHVAA